MRCRRRGRCCRGDGGGGGRGGGRSFLFKCREIESRLGSILILHEGTVKVEEEENLVPGQIDNQFLPRILVVLDLFDGYEHAFGV